MYNSIGDKVKTRVATTVADNTETKTETKTKTQAKTKMSATTTKTQTKTTIGVCQTIQPQYKAIKHFHFIPSVVLSMPATRGGTDCAALSRCH